MGLSNDLMSQFAKVTIDKTKETETTVYGVVKELDGKRYVMLDGSDRLIPLPPATADAMPEDRVSIKIKNHTTTITGNMSSPAARVGSVEEINGKLAVYIPQLEADHAVIENLDAKYATITELDAAKARIDDLEVYEADIEKLHADYAEIDKLIADNAEITNLKSLSAWIDHLYSNTAEIKTLMFGSASGDVLQTTFANAVIAQLGDAQIKSAMIDSVSADKILAGKIVTNNVSVESSDGRLLISNETIQISDENRVRVQIGEDADGDYSIYIWDTDGNLMFDAAGITEHAVKKAIIKNDMVADDANISAGKLDIESLFSEMNNGTHTIKSSKIYYDDEEQTLDVVFKEMKDDVSSQGTQLSVIQGQIESKVWQQDIDKATGDMSTQYSELEQNLNGFKQSVGATYVTKEDLDDLDVNVEVGGRNLLLDTNTAKSAEHFVAWSPNGSTCEVIYHDAYDSDEVTTYGGVCQIMSVSAEGLYVFYKNALTGWLLPDTDYVVSFDILLNGMNYDTYTVRPLIGIGNTQSQNMQAQYAEALNEITPYEDFTRVTCRLHTQLGIPNNTPLNEQAVCINFGASTLVDEIYIRNIKLEQGNTPTTWTPAPEDQATRAEIESVTSKYAEFEQNLDGFKFTVGETYATKEDTDSALGDLSTATEDKLNGFNDRVILAESTIQQLKDTISMLVIDENGESLMEQTSTGWTFKIESIQKSLNSASQNIDTLISDLGSVEAVVDALDAAVSDLGQTAEYVKIMAYDSEPCIALGKKDSVFKLLITNTRIMFLDGDNIPTYINTTGLVTENITVNNEIIQGGWVWKKRANGNYGLIWRGDS